jgi:hypothetical protein
MSMPRAVGGHEASPSLSPALWRRATFTAPFVGPIGDGEPAPPKDGPWTTRAKFAWTPDHLYVLIESVGLRPASPFTRHDELLHQADVVELFLDVTGERRRIVEIQVSPNNVTTDYLHVWNARPDYQTDRIDVDFYRENHHVDLAWNLQGVRTLSGVEPAGNGQTRWTTMMAIPLAGLLVEEGLPPALRPGQNLYVNVLRYAYSGEGDARMFRQYNLIPVRHGCPHQTPMAVAELTTVD